jgi:UDP-N-acetyl-2-amino-2-deoxyglucuronate dehydrogenase
MNQGIHFVDLLLWLMGPVQSVTAYADTLLHSIEVEDTLVASLRFRRGASGVIEATTTAFPHLSDRLEIVGTASFHPISARIGKAKRKLPLFTLPILRTH